MCEGMHDVCEPHSRVREPREEAQASGGYWRSVHTTRVASSYARTSSGTCNSAQYKENVAPRRVTIATCERMACDGRDTFVLRSRHIPDCAFVTSECACSNPRCDLFDSP